MLDVTRVFQGVWYDGEVKGLEQGGRGGWRDKPSYLVQRPGWCARVFRARKVEMSAWMVFVIVPFLPLSF